MYLVVLYQDKTTHLFGNTPGKMALASRLVLKGLSGFLVQIDYADGQRTLLRAEPPGIEKHLRPQHDPNGGVNGCRHRFAKVHGWRRL